MSYQLNRMVPDLELNDVPIIESVASETLVQKDTVMASLENISTDLDASNVSNRADWLSTLIEDHRGTRLPEQVFRRIHNHPVYEILNSVDLHHLNPDRVERSFLTSRLVLEACLLSAPTPAQTCWAGSTISTPIFADPHVEEPSDLRLEHISESFMVIDVVRTSAETVMSNAATFIAGVSFFGNPPTELNEEDPKFPKPPTNPYQDTPSDRVWWEYVQQSAITRALSRQHVNKDDFRADWDHIFTLCSQSGVTPILVFGSEVDFSIFKEKYNHFMHRTVRAHFICIVAPLASERSLQKLTEVLRLAQSGSWLTSSDGQTRLIEKLVELSDVSSTRFFTVYNITREDVAMSLVPADLSLRALSQGPWLPFFRARRFDSMTPFEMLEAFSTTEPKVPFSLQLADPDDLPDDLRNQIRDSVAVELALNELMRSDPPAASHLQRLFQRLFEDDSFTAFERWDAFYDHLDFMLTPAPTHRSPPPKIARLPLPTFFKDGSVVNDDIFTFCPSFSQSMMYATDPMSLTREQSCFPLLISRVLHLQRSLRMTGQLPVTLTPSLRVMVGLDSDIHSSSVNIDWQRWFKADVDRARVMEAYSSYESMSALLPVEDRTVLDAIYSAPQRDRQGKWQTQPSLMIEMIQAKVSPPATICIFQPKWLNASARSFPLNMASIRFREYRLDDWEFLAHFPGDLLDLYQDVEAHLEARILSKNYTQSEWQTFFPLTPTTVTPIARPLILWPMMDLRTNTPRSLLRPADDRSVSRKRPNQQGRLLV